MKRIAFLFTFASSLMCPLVAQDADRSETYAKDVEFLLDELPKQAGRFFAVKKIDWPGVSQQFRAEVKTVHSDEEHLKLCSRLLARLRDGHAGIVQSKVKWPDESQGRTWTGPGVHLLVSGDAVYVRQAFGAAAAAGIKAGMRVEKIDSSPALEWLKKKAASMGDLRGFSTEHQALYAACHVGLADWSGTKVSFEVSEPGAASRVVELIRGGGANYAPTGPVFLPKNLKAYERNSCGKTAAGFAYIHLRKIPGDLDAQLDQMLAEVGDAPGLILDARANSGGGCDHQAVFGRFVPSGQFWRSYESKGAHPFAGPMVVIVDAGVTSAGETVAGMFKEDGRAYMIGDASTAGMSSSKKTLPLPSGLFSAYFSVFSNKARFNGGRGIEGVGVPPHEVVAYNPKDLTTGVDTQIRRAEELLTKGFPADIVDYNPPKKN
jgi:C-terminal processing protease CtpA/Prc